MSAQVLVLIDGSIFRRGQAINVSNAIGLDESLRASCRTAPRSPSTCAPSFSSIPIRARQFCFLPGLTAHHAPQRHHIPHRHFPSSAKKNVELSNSSL